MNTLAFLNECITLATVMADLVAHGKAIGNLIHDNNLSNNYRDTSLYCIDLLRNYQTCLYLINLLLKYNSLCVF